MNMHAPLHDHPLDKSHLPPFLRAEQKPVSGFGRIVGIAATVVIHVAIIAAIVLAGVTVHHALAPPPIVVSLDRPKPVEHLEPPKLPLLAPPRIVTVAAPDIDIAPEIPVRSIQAQAAPTQQAPPAPAATGETQQSYLARLLSHLNRYKRYPPKARAAHIIGVVMLHFVMDKTGHVVTAEINRSSGKPALDAEALALMQRAQPLPAIPPDFGRDTIDAIVPIEFTLRGR